MTKTDSGGRSRGAPTRAMTASALAGGVLAAFFLSGAAGLIHEITWMRLLRHVMGNTTFAVSTVLSVFMGGLALGSLLGGRFIDRRNDPLLVFAVLQGAVAAYGLLLPWLIGAAEPVYGLIYLGASGNPALLNLGRFLFSALLLLVPATLMGATLPVLTKFFTRSLSDVGWSVGRLYAVNTLGAVLGAGATGFLLIPSLGVSRTIYLAAVLNLAVCLASLYLHRRSPAMPEEPRPSRAERRRLEGGGEEPRRARRTPGDRVEYAPAALTALLVGYAISGFAAMAYEVAWVRILTMMIGSSVYAFAMILTSFILGLGLGSGVSARLADRLRDPLRALAIIEVAIGLSALVVVPFMGQLPLVVTRMISRFGESFGRLQMAEFGLILLVVLVPTFLMGAAFPLAARVFVQRRESVGRSVGTVYASNTVGAIFGSFLAGFALIPWLGTQATIFAAVLLNVAIGCAFFGFSVSLRPSYRGLAAGAAVAIVCIGLLTVPDWNPDEMTIGPYIMGRRLSAEVAQSSVAMKAKASSSERLFHKEGMSATVMVKKSGEGDLYLSINGKPEASTAQGDLPTEVMLAQTPLLLHPAPRSALVIGLASGITLGSAGTHPLEAIDCAEISPEVIEACRFFDEYNYHILDDPRVRVLLVDGRNHLVLGTERYDVIISEPSNPWIAGVADLFTLEFFRACHDRLEDGGIACVWLDTYNVNEDVFRSVVATFREVFPSTSLWEPPNSNEFLLIGAKNELAVDYGAVVERMANPRVAADLERVGISTPREFLARLVMGEGGAGRLSDGARIHTDDNSILEFSSPKFLASNESREELLEAVSSHREADLSFLVGDEAELAALRGQVARSIEARGHVFRARVEWRGGRQERAIAELRKAGALDPENIELAVLVEEAVEQVLGPGSRASRAAAAGLLDDLLTVVPGDTRMRLVLAAMLARDGRTAQAIEHYLRVLEFEPDHANAHHDVAVLLGHEGRYGEAISHYLDAVRIDPDRAAAHFSLGVVLREEGESEAAIEHFRRAAGIEPDDARARMEIGATFHRLGRLDEAITEYESAIEIDPSLPEAHNGLGAALASSGDFEGAADSFREALRLRPDFPEARRNLNMLTGVPGGR